MSLELMRKRMDAIGGATSDGRINNGKVNSLRSAMKNSYQAEDIVYNNKKYRCLINPVKLSPDYDQKEISIEFESEMKVGEIFYWARTDTYWMTINQRLTEEAYFRGEIRQCNYEVETDNNRYWIWMRGPIESTTEWKNKHDINYNTLNYSLLFYITKNEDTNIFFKRHQKFKFDGHNWIVTAVDRYSQDGILEVYAEEINDNQMEDESIEPEVDVIDTTVPYIDGPQVVHCYDTGIEYKIKKTSGGSWSITNPKKAKVTTLDNGNCSVDILTGYSGEVTLQYIVDNAVTAELDIRIDSL